MLDSTGLKRRLCSRVTVVSPPGTLPSGPPNSSRCGKTQTVLNNPELVSFLANTCCKPIPSDSIATSDADFHPRHSIHLDENARLTLLEISAGQGTYLLNTVAEIHVAEGAHLTHIRLQQEAATAFHISTTYVNLEAGGTYDSFTLRL